MKSYKEEGKCRYSNANLIDHLYPYTISDKTENISLLFHVWDQPICNEGMLLYRGGTRIFLLGGQKLELYAIRFSNLLIKRKK